MYQDEELPRATFNTVRVAVVMSGGDPGARVLLDAIVTAHMQSRADDAVSVSAAWSELAAEPDALAASIAVAKTQRPYLFIDVAALGLDRLPETRRFAAISAAIVQARRGREDLSQVRAPSRILTYLSTFNWRDSGAHSEPRHRGDGNAGPMHTL